MNLEQENIEIVSDNLLLLENGIEFTRIRSDSDNNIIVKNKSDDCLFSVFNN